MNKGPYMVMPGARLKISSSGKLYETLGQDDGALDTLFSPPVRVGSGALMAYHGYKRTNSVLWALGWSIFGSSMPFFAVPLALAQGFSKKK